MLNKFGIKIQTTSTCTPEQLGIAERYNHIAEERIQAMLLETGLPEKLWGEALQTCMYIYNRTPHKSLGNQTPNEVWYGRKPKLNHLRVFGCSAFIHLPKFKRGKFQPKAEKGYFVGYAVNQKGYRIWYPETDIIEQSSHVIFNENKLYNSRNTNEQMAVEEVLGPTITCPDTDSETDEQFTTTELKKIDPDDLKRVVTPWTKTNGMEVYYCHILNQRLRIRNLNDATKYCNDNQLLFDSSLFNFTTKKALEKNDEPIELSINH